MNVEDLRRDIRNAGYLGAGFDVGYRLANKLTRVMILQIVKLTPDRLNPAALPQQKNANKFKHVFLDELALRGFAGDPANDLSHSFLDEALAKGDRCFAVLDEGRLANYVWCTRKPTRLCSDLVLEFGDEWVYRYKAYTKPAYRGQRLQGTNLANSLQEPPEPGRRGFVCYADANNYSSLKSLRRMGYVDIGRIIVVKSFGSYLIHIDERCRPYGLDLKPVDCRGVGVAVPSQLHTFGSA